MEGYSRVAGLMAKHEEFAILRRFKALNYQNLLYLQAELTHLEDELRELSYQDVAHPERAFFVRDWWSLSHAQDCDGRQQWRKVLRIRKQLNKYNNTIWRQAQLSKLATHNRHDLEFLRSWMERPSMGDFPIRGLDRDAWDPRYDDDLVAINPRSAPDLLSRWVSDTLMPAFHRLIGEKTMTNCSTDLGNGIVTYSETTISVVINVLTTVVAATLPVLSTLLLYLVQSETMRLTLVVVLSALFSLILALMTNSRKIEVFAATCAWVPRLRDFATVHAMLNLTGLPP